MKIEEFRLVVVEATGEALVEARLRFATPTEAASWLSSRVAGSGPFKRPSSEFPARRGDPGKDPAE